MKTLKIAKDIHKALKIYCIEHDISIIKFIENIIKKEIGYDNNQKSEVEDSFKE